jgi:hypothetical protein
MIMFIKIAGYISLVVLMIFVTQDVHAVTSGSGAVTTSISEGHSDDAYHKELLKLLQDSSNPLTQSQLATFKNLLKVNGWPTVAKVGRDGVDAAGVLLERSSSDYDFQKQALNDMDPQIGVDVNPFGFAWLSDDIKVQHGFQVYGTHLAVIKGKVTPVPAMKRPSNVVFFRDFYGLPTVEESIAATQRKVDDGIAIQQANPRYPLSQAFKPYTRPDVRNELGRMIAADQNARVAAIKASKKDQPALMAKVGQVDEQNLAKIKAIFDEVGFPTMDMVGRDGVSTAFLLVQHADSDRPFQERALKLALPLMEQRELSRQEYAMLTDRVLLGQGKPQVYGTQVTKHGDAYAPMTVVDPKNLDARRAKMGMLSEKAYLDEVRAEYEPSNSK